MVSFRDASKNCNKGYFEQKKKKEKNILHTKLNKKEKETQNKKSGIFIFILPLHGELYTSFLLRCWEEEVEGE
jgi:hypothetical protein